MEKFAPITRIVLATQNKTKEAALREVVSKYDSLKDIEIVLKDSQPKTNPPQPVNSGYECSVDRINEIKSDFASESTIFVSIESEITNRNSEVWHDVAHSTVHRNEHFLTAHSFPVNFPQEYYEKAKSETSDDYELRERGFSITVGGLIAKDHEGVQAGNWMKNEIFGGIDRHTQIVDSLNAVFQKMFILEKVTSIENFPIPNVIFRDLSFVLADKVLFKYLCEAMKQLVIAEGWDKKVTKVMGFDARGFIYGPLIAREFNAGFLMLRKKGKLPGNTIQYSYKTEYSTAILELVEGVVEPGDNIILVDDVIATGGTLGAGIEILKSVEGVNILGTLCIIKVLGLYKEALQKIHPYS